MNRVISTCLLLSLASVPTFAAQIETYSEENGYRTGWTIITVSDDGVLHIQDGSWGSSAEISASAAGSNPKVQYHKGRADDITIFDPRPMPKPKLRSVEKVGNKLVCYELTEDSAPPPGVLQGFDIGKQQKQMADLMAGQKDQIKRALQQAEAQGMTDDQLRALKQMTGVFDMSNTETDDTLHLIPLNTTIDVNGIEAAKWLVKTAGGVEKYHLGVADERKVPGGAKIKRRMLGMIDLYSAYMDNTMGGADVIMGESLTAALTSPELDGTYPLVIWDLERRTVDKVVRFTDKKSEETPVDFDPNCDTRPMMQRY